MTTRLSTTKGLIQLLSAMLHRGNLDVGLLCDAGQNDVKQERNVKDAYQKRLIKGVLGSALCAVERGDGHGVRAARQAPHLHTHHLGRLIKVHNLHQRLSLPQPKRPSVKTPHLIT